MSIAGEICIYSNDKITIEELMRSRRHRMAIYLPETTRPTPNR